MKRKTKYYTLDKILEEDAQYNVIFGERSNGKTYAGLLYGIKNYIERGEQFALVRRWQDDFTGKRGQTIFDGIVQNSEISKLTGGEWTGIYYYASKWYLSRYENENRIISEEPICYGFAISSMEHDKSTSYPKVTTIIFDEFITRGMYLRDEFVLFMNVVSTIIRDRQNVKIFMFGNTVNQYCPYFNEMGLKHIKDMKQGTIDVYTYGDSDLKVAVEYTKQTQQGKKSDMYFAFDNPKLSMITGGSWEIDIYPHCPYKYKEKDVLFHFYIVFDGEILDCEIINKDEDIFTFIHKKTTPLQDKDTDLIYSQTYDPRPNYHRRINNPTDKITRKIYDIMKKEKVFYADNVTGEIMRNYLIWCGKKA